MSITETEITTDRASRYLTQLCRHATAMASTKGHRFRPHAGGDTPTRDLHLTAEASDTTGVIRFAPWGTCTLQATSDTLMVRVEATDEEKMHRIQDIITNDLERFGRREHLSVTWRTPAAPTAPTPVNHLPNRWTELRRDHRLPILVTVAGGLAVAVHLGLGGYLLAYTPWTVSGAVVILAVLLVKLAVIVLGRKSIRRCRAAPAPPGSAQ